LRFRVKVPEAPPAPEPAAAEDAPAAEAAPQVVSLDAFR
jgi:hypothetical protein